MKPNTCLVVDVWEGQLEVDEAVLIANGVAGMSIRINDMNGGHHMDANFLKQWSEAKNMVRFPYFVYNPWVTGAANFEWLAANAPAEVKSIAVDVEVRKTGYFASTYAGELVKFLNLCQPRWKMIIYTAQWFLPYLSSWPKIDYWWAQYPYSDTYFKGVTTWDELRLRLDKLDKPFNLASVPGNLKMWQFSGDYLKLPGNSRAIDVNIFYGTPEDLKNYFGGNTTPPQYYRLLHDAESAKWNFAPRPMGAQDTAPESIKIEGGKGSVSLSPAWEHFIDVINTVDAGKFIRKPGTGWANSGGWPLVDQLSFGGNTVEVTSIEGDRAYIKCYYNNEAPPATTGTFYDPSRIHYFTEVRKNGALESPSAGYVRTIIIAKDSTERLWIPLSELQKVDSLTIYMPGTIANLPALYTFSPTTFTQRPDGGPLTLAMSRVRQLGDNLTRYPWATLKPALEKINPTNPAAVGLISSANWGPSKGIEGTDIKWIALLWPGRNVVKINEIVDGWGRVDGVPLASAGTVTAADNPDQVHMVYDYNKTNGYGERANPVYVPILEGPWWVEMSNLISIQSVLPKIVKIKASPRLNVRSDARSDAPVVGYKNYGESVVVNQVKIGKGGLWGLVTGGWIALRNNGVNWTDWNI